MTATVSTGVAGSWIDGAPVITGGGLHQVINPATGEAVADYALASPAEVETPLSAQGPLLPELPAHMTHVQLLGGVR